MLAEEQTRMRRLWSVTVLRLVPAASAVERDIVPALGGQVEKM